MQPPTFSRHIDSETTFAPFEEVWPVRRRLDGSWANTDFVPYKESALFTFK